MFRRKMPDVMVVIPGILGSVLRQRGREVWGLSAAAGMHALTSLGGSLHDLTLTADSDDPDELIDDVEAAGVLPDLHLIPYLWKVDGYTELTDALKRTFVLERDKNYFEFAYDWRRDNRAAARRLAKQSKDWLLRWRETSGNESAKLIFITHSMGGLVARYFLEVLEGWRDAKALVTFGTPFRGSVNALRTLAEGITKGPFGVIDLSALVRSLTSVYQLLPVYRCVEDSEGHLVHLADVPQLRNVSVTRLDAANRFHAEIRRSVEDHSSDDSYCRSRYRLLAVVGTHQKTLQSARFAADGKIEFLHRHAEKDFGGDGTVPRISATPVDRSNMGIESYVATCHASMQNSAGALHHVCEAIANLDLDLTSVEFRWTPEAPTKLALDLDDAYWDDEPVSIRILAEPRPSPALNATIFRIGNCDEVARVTFPPGYEEWISAELPPLPPGAYRCTVAGHAAVQPVADVFIVYSRSSR